MAETVLLLPKACHVFSIIILTTNSKTVKIRMQKNFLLTWENWKSLICHTECKESVSWFWSNYKLSVVHYSVLCWNSSRVISLWSIPSFISICQSIVEVQPHIHFGMLAKFVKAINENGLVYEKPLDTFLAALSEDDLS